MTFYKENTRRTDHMLMMMMTARQGYRIRTFFTAAGGGSGSEVGFYGLVAER